MSTGGSIYDNRTVLIDLEVDSETLSIDEINNRVGIGVTDPDSTLEVFSSTTQQKWSYDADSFATLTVANDSHTTIATGESGDLTLDAADDIILDSHVGKWRMMRNGTLTNLISATTTDGSKLVFDNQVVDAGYEFKCNDGGSGITALSIDAANAGDATFSNNVKVTGDIILDDGGSIKEAGGTAAITIDASGHVTKIGQDSPSSGQFLKYDGSKWVADAVATGSSAADDITTGDAAVTIATTSGNITLDAQEGDADIIFKGTDNAADITALTLDMSEAGAALFNAAVTVGTDLTVTGGDIVFGNGQNATVDVADVSGTNTAGKSLTILGGAGTGSGAGGDLIFQTANAGSSGSSVNSHATALTISDDLSSTFAGVVNTGVVNSTVTAATGVTLDHNYSVTTASTTIGLDIDFDKTGNTTSDNTMIGINVDMDNTEASNGTNTMIGAKLTPTLQHAVAAGITLVKGMEITATGSGPGNTTTRALDLTATGADFNQGLFMKIDDGGPDIKMLSSADTGDFCTMATGANGAFTITTTDDDGANGHINLMPDGNVGIGTDSPAQILQVSDAAPIVVVQNTTNEHTDGGAESKVLFADHAGNALSQVEGAHSGSSDDAKGQFKVSVNNGSGMQLAMSIDDTQLTTFSGDVVIAGTNPKLTIGDAGTEDTMLVFDGNAQDYRIGIDDGTDTLEIGVGTAHGTTPALTVDSSQNIDVFKAINLDSAIADNSVCGITAVFTAGEALNRGDVVYFKAADSKMHKVNMTAGSSEAIPAVAMAADDISADAVGKFLLQGFIHDAGTFPSYTVAGRLYAPEAEGPPTQTAPSTDGDLVQVIGWAVTADKIYFNPSPDFIEVA